MIASDSEGLSRLSWFRHELAVTGNDRYQANGDSVPRERPPRHDSGYTDGFARGLGDTGRKLSIIHRRGLSNYRDRSTVLMRACPRRVTSFESYLIYRRGFLRLGIAGRGPDRIITLPFRIPARLRTTLGDDLIPPLGLRQPPRARDAFYRGTRPTVNQSPASAIRQCLRKIVPNPMLSLELNRRPQQVSLPFDGADRSWHRCDGAQ